MINTVICLARNNLHLTKKAVKSILAQDIPVELLLIDNASTDGTSEWTRTQHFQVIHFHEQVSVAGAWNMGLNLVFGLDSIRRNQNPNPAAYCLVVNNDVELRPDTYRWLIEDGGGFVTAVGSNDPEKIKPYDGVWHRQPDARMKRPHPDFSCFLIRRDVWEMVGVFDEKFEVAFFEDNCYHIRLHRAGIKAECLDLPFYHHGSATIKNADPEEQHRIRAAAARNKAYFRKKYGVDAGSPEYYALFGHSAPPTSDDPAA